MRRNRFRFKTLSFTILSSDANKDVTRFKIPRIIIPIFVLLFMITPIILFVHFFQTSKQLAIENAKLTQNLDDQTERANDLFVEVIDLKKKENEVRAHLDTLYELESQVKETMKGLPVDIEPSGGIDIEVTEEEALLMQASSSNLNLQTAELINRYRNTINVMEKTSYELQFIPTEWPIKPNKITSKFGLRTDPFRRISSFHTGIDIRGNFGEPIFAAADGEVILAEYSGGHGNYIIINHSDKYETRYAHLAKIDVLVGEKVKKGQIIGSVGSTGRSTGPHLHYEIIENGKPIDPYTYLSIFDQYEEGK